MVILVGTSNEECRGEFDHFGVDLLNEKGMLV